MAVTTSNFPESVRCNSRPTRGENRDLNTNESGMVPKSPDRTKPFSELGGVYRGVSRRYMAYSDVCNQGAFGRPYVEDGGIRTLKYGVLYYRAIPLHPVTYLRSLHFNFPRTMRWLFTRWSKVPIPPKPAIPIPPIAPIPPIHVWRSHSSRPSQSNLLRCYSSSVGVTSYGLTTGQPTKPLLFSLLLFWFLQKCRCDLALASIPVEISSLETPLCTNQLSPVHLRNRDGNQLSPHHSHGPALNLLQASFPSTPHPFTL